MQLLLAWTADADLQGVGDRSVERAATLAAAREGLANCDAAVAVDLADGTPADLLAAVRGGKHCGPETPVVLVGEAGEGAAGFDEVVPEGDSDALAAALAAVERGLDYRAAVDDLYERCRRRAEEPAGAAAGTASSAGGTAAGSDGGGADGDAGDRGGRDAERELAAAAARARREYERVRLASDRTPYAHLLGPEARRDSAAPFRDAFAAGEALSEEHETESDGSEE